MILSSGAGGLTLMRRGDISQWLSNLTQMGGIKKQLVEYSNSLEIIS